MTPEMGMSYSLNYDDLVFLDAEELAEVGIGRAYESLLPQLRKYVQQPLQVEEIVDDDAPSYSVKCGTKEFGIYGPDIDGANCSAWARATFAFFTIINDQISRANVCFYAINDGNDLGGLLLTPAQAEAAQETLSNKRDWPYLPTDERPWFGQHH